MTFSTLVGVFLFLTVSAAPTDEATELARALQSPPTDDVATGRVWEILNSSSDQAVLKRAEFGFAERLEARKLPALAFIYCSGILSQGPAHPHFADTLRLLLRVQATIHDDLFISALLEKHFQPTWSKLLSAEEFGHVQYLRARIAHRNGRLEDAVAMASDVKPPHRHRAKAQYLVAVTIADPRFRQPTREVEATVALEAILAMPEGTREDLARVKGLAALALGSIEFADRRWAQSVGHFERAVGPEARLAEAHARFMNDDRAGALTLLQRPELRTEPEAVLLEAKLQFFSLDADRTDAALDTLAGFLPMLDGLETRIAGLEKTPGALATLLRDGTGVPAVVLGPARRFRRLDDVSSLVEEYRREKAFVEARGAWQPKLSAELSRYVVSNLDLAVRVADTMSKSRLQYAIANVRGYASHGDILRFENALARTERAPDAGTAAPIVALERVLAGVDDSSPYKAELRFQLADLCWQAGTPERLDQAATELARVAHDPAFPRLDEVLFAAGTLAHQRGKLDEASAFYVQLMKARPDSPLAGEAAGRYRKRRKK